MITKAKPGSTRAKTAAKLGADRDSIRSEKASPSRVNAKNSGLKPAKPLKTAR